MIKYFNTAILRLNMFFITLNEIIAHYLQCTMDVADDVDVNVWFRVKAV